MTLDWLEFPISLVDLKVWLDDTIPNTDGIVADDRGFEIVERERLTDDERNAILAHIADMTEESEAAKIVVDMRKYPTIPEHQDNARATAAGLTVGEFYRTGEFLKVVY